MAMSITQGQDRCTAVRLSIVNHHSKAFSKLGPGQLASLKQKAFAYSSKKIEMLEDSRAHVVAQMELFRARQQEDSNSGLVNHVDSFRFSPEEFSRCAELWPQYTVNDHATLTCTRMRTHPKFT